MRIIKNQNGESLVSVVVAAAIGTFIMLGIASGISKLYSSQRSANIGFSANLLNNNMRLTFDTPKMCDQALMGKSFNPSGTVSLSGTTLDIGGTPVSMVVDSEIQPGLKLKRFDIVGNRQVGPKLVKIDGVSHNRYIAHVVIETEKMGSRIGVSPPPQYIPVSVVVPLGFGAQPIKTCGAQATVQDLCYESLGIWDPTKPDGKKCQPAAGCKYGGSYSDPNVPANLGGYKNEFTNNYNCPTGFSAQQTGAITKTTQCGKNCVRNIYYPTFECIVCTDRDGAAVALSSVTPGSFSDEINAGYTDADEAASENIYNDVVDVPGLPACTASNLGYHPGSHWLCYCVPKAPDYATCSGVYNWLYLDLSGFYFP